jgi:hypothetical protein
MRPCPVSIFDFNKRAEDTLDDVVLTRLAHDTEHAHEYTDVPHGRKLAPGAHALLGAVRGGAAAASLIEYLRFAGGARRGAARAMRQEGSVRQE